MKKKLISVFILCALLLTMPQQAQARHHHGAGAVIGGLLIGTAVGIAAATVSPRPQQERVVIYTEPTTATAVQQPAQAIVVQQQPAIYQQIPTVVYQPPVRRIAPPPPRWSPPPPRFLHHQNHHRPCPPRHNR